MCRIFFCYFNDYIFVILMLDVDQIFSEFRDYLQFQSFHFHIDIFKPDPQATVFRIWQTKWRFAEFIGHDFAIFLNIPETSETD